MTISTRLLPAVTLVLALSVLALSPSTALAQMETFVSVVRELATASAGSPAVSTLPAIRDRLRASLAEWDRALKAAEASAPSAAASPAQMYAWRLQLGAAYHARGRYADALREFDAAATLHPEIAEPKMRRALALAAMGRDDEAGRAYRLAFAADPASAVLAYQVLRGPGSTLAEGRDAAATRLAGAYGQLSANAQAMPPFAVASALPDYIIDKPAVAGDPVTARAFAQLAGGYFDAAVATLATLDATTPSGTPPGDSPRAHLPRADAAAAQNQLTDARHEYQAVLAGTLAGRSIIYIGLGRVAAAEGDFAAAVDAFTRATRLDPNNAFIHKELATALIADGRGDEAFAEGVAALLIDPRDGQAHALIGQILLDAGRSADAVTAFTRSLEVMPSRYETHYALAQALTRLGRGAEAQQHLEAFEKTRRELLDRRRRGIDAETDKEDAIYKTLTDHAPR